MSESQEQSNGQVYRPEEELEHLRTLLAQERAQVTNLTQRARHAESQALAFEHDRDRLDRELGEAKKKREPLEAEVVQLRQASANLLEHLGEKDKEIAYHRDQAKDIARERNLLNEKLGTLEAQVADLEKKTHGIEQALEAENERLIRQVETLKEECLQISDILAAARAEKANLTEEREALIDALTLLMRHYKGAVKQ